MAQTNDTDHDLALRLCALLAARFLRSQPAKAELLSLRGYEMDADDVRDDFEDALFGFSLMIIEDLARGHTMGAIEGDVALDRRGTPVIRLTGSYR